jgi:hypothetical protein
MYWHPGQASIQTFTSRIAIPQAGHSLEFIVFPSVPIACHLSNIIGSEDDACATDPLAA